MRIVNRGVVRFAEIQALVGVASGEPGPSGDPALGSRRPREWVQPMRTARGLTLLVLVVGCGRESPAPRQPETVLLHGKAPEHAVILHTWTPHAALLNRSAVKMFAVPTSGPPEGGFPVNSVTYLPGCSS
jgi:hypothetical protein